MWVDGPLAKSVRAGTICYLDEIVEAHRGGIHSYCIIIDKEVRDYLPHMYGASAYTVIDEIQQLPLKVSDIYQRLTM